MDSFICGLINLTKRVLRKLLFSLLISDKICLSFTIE